MLYYNIQLGEQAGEIKHVCKTHSNTHYNIINTADTHNPAEIKEHYSFRDKWYALHSFRTKKNFI